MYRQALEIRWQPMTAWNLALAEMDGGHWERGVKILEELVTRNGETAERLEMLGTAHVGWSEEIKDPNLFTAPCGAISQIDGERMCTVLDPENPNNSAQVSSISIKLLCCTSRGGGSPTVISLGEGSAGAGGGVGTASSKSA